jgi:hypothetical protein
LYDISLEIDKPAFLWGRASSIPTTVKKWLEKSHNTLKGIKYQRPARPSLPMPVVHPQMITVNTVKQTVSVAAVFSTVCKPKNLIHILAFVAGQVSWFLVVVLILVVGTTTPTFWLAFWVLTAISIAVWTIVIAAVIRLAIVGARSLGDLALADPTPPVPDDGENGDTEQAHNP